MNGLINQGKPEQSKTITPDASGQTVSPDAGKTLSSVVVNGDADLAAENIKSGTNIFGVNGNLTVPQCATGVSAATSSGVLYFTCGFRPTAFIIASNGGTSYTLSNCSSCYPDGVTCAALTTGRISASANGALINDTGGYGANNGYWHTSVRWIAIKN